MHPLLWTMASGPAGPLPRPVARRANTPPRVPRPQPAPSTATTPVPAPAASPVPTVPIRPAATAQSLWELLSYDSHLLLETRRLHLQS